MTGMTHESNHPSKSISKACSAFENEWNKSKRPTFLKYLDQVEPEHRDQLLLKLIEIDIRLRCEAGLPVAAADYELLGEQCVSHAAELLSENHESIVDLGEDNAIGTRTHTVAPKEVSFNKQVGPYKLLQQIGEGGMGTVWMAEQEKPVRRRVALKLIRENLDSKETIARFEAERQALAMMDHQNIAKVLDAGTTENGQPYFVMELVKGIPITEFCDENKLSINERLGLFVPVCKAVQHAHQKGIIHRDLKPSNVLVTLYDGEAVPKVIDFGLAKALQHTNKLTDKTMFTEFGKVVGTIQYMSPEQAEMNALDVDTRTDVYSLGVMLYELLTGSTPLDKETVGENALLQILAIIKEKEPPRPSHRLSSSSETLTSISAQRKIAPAKLQHLLRGELDWVVMKALEKDRRRRYETANDFAEDIGRYLGGDVVQAKPPSATYKLSKLFQKNKGLVTSVCAIVALLIIAVAGTSYGMLVANQKTELAGKKVIEAQEEKRRADQQTNRASQNEKRALAAEKVAEIEAATAKDAAAAANIQLAIARWNENQVGEAIELLEEVPVEYQNNLEWRLCRNQLSGSDITLYGHTNYVNQVAFSPDGSLITSVSNDGTMKIWEAVSGRLIRDITNRDINVLSFSYSTDGTKLFVGSNSNVSVLDSSSFKKLRTLQGLTGTVCAIDSSPDGSLVAAGYNNGAIAVWDLKSGQQVFDSKVFSRFISKVEFSPNSKRLVTASYWESHIVVFDTSNGRELLKIEGNLDGVRDLSFSPNGERFVAGGFNRSLSIWNSTTGSLELTRKGHGDQIDSVTFSPDGTQIASTSNDKLVKIWDAATFQEIAVLRGHLRGVSCVAFSPDGSRIVTGGWDNLVKVWDAKQFDRNLTFKKHSHAITSVAFGSSDKIVAAASYDHRIKAWNVDTGEIAWIASGDHHPVRTIRFDQSGEFLISIGNYGVQFWNTETGTQSSDFKQIGAIDINQSFEKVASATDGKIIIQSIKNPNDVISIIAHEKTISDIAFSPVINAIASGSWDKTVKFWDTDTGKCIHTLAGHNAFISDIDFNPYGNQIASADNQGFIKIWNSDTGKEIRTLDGHRRVVSCIKFSPDGRRLASACDDRTVKIWDPNSGDLLLTLESIAGYPKCLAFSENANRLAVGFLNHAVVLWDAAPGQETKTLKGNYNPRLIRNVEISQDGTKVYSDSRDQDNKTIWDAKTGNILSVDQWENDEARSNVSIDGKWMVVPLDSNVLLIDQDFKNTPREKAYREAKARFDPHWHSEQAENMERTKHWYAATFHRAWLMKANPNSPDNFDALHEAYDKLAAQYKSENKPLDPYLAPIVKKMLELPRGDETLEEE